MASKTSITGYNTKIAGTTTLSSGVEVRSVSIPSITVDDVDLTAPSGTAAADKWKSFEAGMKDPGEITVEVPFDDSNVSEIVGAVGIAAETWTITFSDASTWACSGYVKSVSGSADYESAVNFGFTIKLTGAPTFTTSA